MFGIGRPEPDVLIATLLAFVVSIAVHEFSHAWSALQLGDDTAARQGRVTLNPLAHLDPVGTIGLLLVAVVGFGIGWGRPVPINPARLRGHQRGMAVTALAGPVSNIVLATLFAIPIRFGAVDAFPGFVQVLLGQMVLVNVLLASFNLIPIPPLDGHKILTGILPNFWYPLLAPLERYGVFILLVLIMFGGIGRSILTPMYSPVFNTLVSLILG